MNLARVLIVASAVFGPAVASVDAAKASVIDQVDLSSKSITDLIAASLGAQTKQIAESLNKISEYVSLFKQTQDPTYQDLADLETVRAQAEISQYRQTVDIGESLLKGLPSSLLGSVKFYTSPDLYLRLSALANPLNTTMLRFATSNTDGYTLDLALESGGVSTPLIDLYIPADGGSVPVTPTPLPPGILLFAGSLLTLAAVGYGVRRR